MFMSRLLTPQEVTERLSMSQGKVYQLIRKGVFTSDFDQRRIMVQEDD